jgi:hypothetical protein
MTTDAPCRCWANTHALGHEGHCCFTGDGKWRDDEDICHSPATSQTTDKN